jgi:hypothetical protein
MYTARSSTGVGRRNSNVPSNNALQLTSGAVREWTPLAAERSVLRTEGSLELERPP